MQGRTGGPGWQAFDTACLDGSGLRNLYGAVRSAYPSDNSSVDLLPNLKRIVWSSALTCPYIHYFAGARLREVRLHWMGLTYGPHGVLPNEFSRWDHDHVVRVSARISSMLALLAPLAFDEGQLSSIIIDATERASDDTPADCLAALRELERRLRRAGLVDVRWVHGVGAEHLLFRGRFKLAILKVEARGDVTLLSYFS